MSDLIVYRSEDDSDYEPSSDDSNTDTDEINSPPVRNKPKVKTKSTEEKEPKEEPKKEPKKRTNTSKKQTKEQTKTPKKRTNTSKKQTKEQSKALKEQAKSPKKQAKVPKKQANTSKKQTKEAPEKQSKERVIKPTEIVEKSADKLFSSNKPILEISFENENGELLENEEIMKLLELLEYTDGDDYKYSIYQEDDEILEELKHENPEMYKTLTQVREYLMEELPKIEQILQAQMHLEDRARLVELYEIFATTEPLTEVWIDMKHRIRKIFSESVKKYQEDQLFPEQYKNVQQNLETLNKQVELFRIEKEIANLDLPVKFKKLIYEKYTKMKMLQHSGSDEYGKVYEWVTTVIKVPFNKYISLNTNEESFEIIKNVYEELNKNFYGLESVKEQVLIYVNNRLNNPNLSQYCLGLVSQPGCGKTELTRSLSKILKIPFRQISCDSLTKDSLHGHNYTYVGSQPGEIVKSLIEMKASNGIIFFDEFDKIPTSKNLNGLLHIIDPVQNSTFKDEYIGSIPIDISKVWYVLSMNELPENKALRDRIYTITIPGYSLKDKVQILKKHTLPTILKKMDIHFTVDDETLAYLIKRVTVNKNDGGMRTSIHALKDVIYKLAFLYQNPNIEVTFKLDTKLTQPIHITKEIIEKIVSVTPDSSSPFIGMYT